MISYNETPVQEISSQAIEQAGVRLLIKREDQNHPEVSGNKWWKLKHNLEAAINSQAHTLLSFGGRYSNHIHALAGAASLLGMKSIGIIRGEESYPLNDTLKHVISKGMTLHYVSREEYRKKTDEEFLNALHHRFGDFFTLPEGGTNTMAVKGCREFGEKLVRENAFDYIAMPVGTGGSFAGILGGLSKNQEAIGISVLKNGDFLEEEVRQWIGPSNPVEASWRIETRYAFGGYAKTTGELMKFIEVHKTEHKLPLDHVYTGKALFGILDMIQRGEIRRGSTVLMVHTGGLQGAALSK